MLTESFQKHPRIIIVSIHVIGEIAETMHSAEEKAYCISGLEKDVKTAARNLNIIGQDAVGGLAISC